MKMIFSVVYLSLFLFGVNSCVHTSEMTNYSRFEKHLEKKGGIMAYRKEGSFEGYWLNLELRKEIKKMSLSEQAKAYALMREKYGAKDFDGEIAFDFKSMFQEPYGIDQVKKEMEHQK